MEVLLAHCHPEGKFGEIFNQPIQTLTPSWLNTAGAPLLIDVNLFTSSFQVSLAEALDRAIENAEVPALLQGDSSGVAATAS